MPDSFPKSITSLTEENYLKTIFHISENKNWEAVSTNELAESIQNRAASVTDMLKKLSEKGLINYIKYQGVTLSPKGKAIALNIIRKHRLWEVFLVQKLGFGWDEIHEIAEQLEHIESQDLTDRLEHFLGNPKFDPHGDPIPNTKGEMPVQKTIKLSNAEIDQNLILMGVSEDSSAFLQHLDRLQLKIGSIFKIKRISEFDNSIELLMAESTALFLSHDVSKNLLVALK